VVAMVAMDSQEQALVARLRVTSAGSPA